MSLPANIDIERCWKPFSGPPGVQFGYAGIGYADSTTTTTTSRVVKLERVLHVLRSISVVWKSVLIGLLVAIRYKFALLQTIVRLECYEKNVKFYNLV